MAVAPKAALDPSQSTIIKKWLSDTYQEQKLT
jgi:hypothetical protein